MRNQDQPRVPCRRIRRRPNSFILYTSVSPAQLASWGLRLLKKEPFQMPTALMSCWAPAGVRGKFRGFDVEVAFKVQQRWNSSQWDLAHRATSLHAPDGRSHACLKLDAVGRSFVAVRFLSSQCPIVHRSFRTSGNHMSRPGTAAPPQSRLDAHVASHSVTRSSASDPRIVHHIKPGMLNRIQRNTPWHAGTPPSDVFHVSSAIAMTPQP